MQRMISRMARMYPLVIFMGFLIVVVALVIGYFNSGTAADYFAAEKTVREATLMAQRSSIEATGLWLPYFKFLGIGLILAGIVMALRVIIDSLNKAGKVVLANLPTEKRPNLQKPPWYASWMPMIMMLGILIFIAAFIASLFLASTASQVFANPIPVIDSAGPGSELLALVQNIRSTSAWLVPFKFVGISSMFLSIAIGLGTIVYILTEQTKMLNRGIEIARQAQRAMRHEKKTAA